MPKGVEITHYNIVSNCLQVIFKRNMVADTAIGRQRQARVRLSGERWLAPLPMFHAYVSRALLKSYLWIVLIIDRVKHTTAVQRLAWA